MVIEEVLEKRLELARTKEFQNFFAEAYYGINEKGNSALRLYSYFALGVVEAILFLESSRRYLINKIKRDKK